jgi:uncharacterized membrane-anchored protein
MPGQPPLSAQSAELRASVRKSLSGLQQIQCDLKETIAKSRATIAESTTLIAQCERGAATQINRLGKPRA